MSHTALVRFFRICSFLLAGLICWFINPAELEAQTEKLYFHHLNTGNGLSQSSCLFIYRDSYGFIWISSTDGLMRFDGQSVHTYRPEAGNKHSLYSKNVQSHFFEDEHHNLWFSTHDAIHVYRRKTDDFEHFFIHENNTKIEEATYSVLFYEPDRLAISVNNEDLYWIYPGSIDTINNLIAQRWAGKVTGDRCYAEPDAQTGRISTFFTFVRATGGGPGFAKYIVDGDSVRLKRSFFDGTNRMPEMNIKDLLDDHAGHLWLATSEGLVRYDMGTGKWISFNQIKPGKTIRQSEGLVQDGPDCLWVSTNLGLTKFNLSTETFQELYEPVTNGSYGPAGVTSDLYLDNTHVLWSSILGTGVDFTPLNKTKFSILPVPEKDGSQFSPGTLEEDQQGNIWIGSNSKRLKKYTRSGPEAGTWTEFPYETWKVKSMPDDRMFVATMDTFSYVVTGKDDIWHLVKTNDGKNIGFGDVCIADKQSLWGVRFQPNGGLWKIDQEDGQYQATRVKSSLFNCWFSRVYQDQKSQLYLAQDFNSLLIYAFKGATPVLISKTRLRGDTWAFYEDGRFVWIGGEYGLCRIDKNTHEELLLEEKDGLPNSSVNGILPDDSSYLWLSTKRGIVRFQKDSFLFRQYSLADGLQDFEFTMMSFLKTKDGQLWFGGTKGINVFHPDSIRDLQTLPVVQITNLLVNDQPYKLPRNVTLIDSLEFSFEQNTISFDFVAIEYNDPANNKLQYRLYNESGEPYDDNWVSCKNAKGFARYSNLPPGAYILYIKGANSDGVWNPQTKRIFIRINPPFYQTIPFYLTVLLLVAGLILLIFRAVITNKLRLKNIQLREQRLHIEKQDALTQERNRIAAEMHDDFGSGLTAIQRISERTAAKLPTPEARQAIENITTYSLELIANMREIIWAMSGKNDNLENLMAYISEYAYRYLDNHNIDVDVVYPENCPNVEMSGERRRNIYLAVKESLHNVVKHANATKVTITFETNGTFNIHVHDNGKGFENNNLAGNGMGNMHKRIEDIGGSMKMENDNGTHLIFSLPIAKLKA